MAIRIGDTAPDFEADTTQGRIRFHEWLGDSWDVRANFYNPTSHGIHRVGFRSGTEPFFQGNRILFRDIRLDEVALTAADLEEPCAEPLARCRRHMHSMRPCARLHFSPALRANPAETADRVKRLLCALRSATPSTG